LKTQHIISIVFSLLLLGCAGDEPVTKEFKQYFVHTFNKSPENGHVYLLMPSNQCRYCINFGSMKVPEKLLKHFDIVSCFPKSDYKTFSNVYYDKQQNMMSLNLLDYSKRIVVYDNDKVQKVIPVIDLFTQLDSIASTIN